MANTINNSVLNISTLEKEYDIYLKQYQEVYKNYLNILNTSSNPSTNPCENYNLESKSVSQECFNKIWTDQGCTMKPPTLDNWKKQQTYNGLVKDSYLWATLPDNMHRKGCYGNSTKYTTKTMPTYSFGKEYTELPGKTWWGTYGIKEGTVNSKEECISMCNSNSSCTGATFNPVKRYCWARGGNGIVTAGLKTDIALIPKIKEVLLTLSALNNNLLSINEKLRAETQKINPRFEEDKINNEIQKNKFDQYYNELYYDKTQMEKMMDEYNSINAELNDQTLFVNQQSLSLRLWTLFTLILCFIVLKKMRGSSDENVKTDSIINKVFLFLILICIFSINKPFGFATMGFILISFLVYKLNFND